MLEGLEEEEHQKSWDRFHANIEHDIHGSQSMTKVINYLRKTMV